MYRRDDDLFHRVAILAEGNRPGELMMKAVLVLLGLLLVTILAVSHRAAGPGVYRELVPTRNASTDEKQTMAFYFGPVVFQIKNKSLAFPFPRGDRPFDASICGRSDLSDSERKLCANPKKSVFLFVPVPAGFAGGDEKAFVAPVTLGYRQVYRFDERPVDEFARELNAWEGGRQRVQKLDTRNYAAVLVLPNEKFRKDPVTGRENKGSYFFVAQGRQSPHDVFCWSSPDERDIPGNVLCVGRTGFLTYEFPRESSGGYPFTLEYEFPGSELDHAPEIEDAILKAVSVLPHAPAPSRSP